jgi:hypothetical protein
MVLCLGIVGWHQQLCAQPAHLVAGNHAAPSWPGFRAHAPRRALESRTAPQSMFNGADALIREIRHALIRETRQRQPALHIIMEGAASSSTGPPHWQPASEEGG